MEEACCRWRRSGAHPTQVCGEHLEHLVELRELTGERAHEPLDLLKLPAASGELGRALRLAPLVGLVVGVCGALVTSIAVGGLGLPPLPAALLTIGATIWITGALHEDGLADVADGFGGAFERSRKLAIMRDSRIGAYGVLALILSIGLRAAALAALTGPEVASAVLIAAISLLRSVT